MTISFKNLSMDDWNNTSWILSSGRYPHVYRITSSNVYAFFYKKQTNLVELIIYKFIVKNISKDIIFLWAKVQYLETFQNLVNYEA
jgi:hypothetical protein